MIVLVMSVIAYVPNICAGSKMLQQPCCQQAIYTAQHGEMPTNGDEGTADTYLPIRASPAAPTEFSVAAWGLCIYQQFGAIPFVAYEGSSTSCLESAGVQRVVCQ